MIKLLTVIGARPQFVKAAALSYALSKDDNIQETIIHTGQHFDESMSHVFFDELNIPEPKYNLGINSLSHGAMTGKMMIALDEIFTQESPDVVLVYGDTNSTLAAGLTAQKLHIPVVHVEAGLRSFNMRMPEEVNRILTDRISKILFCPTENALNNLREEGYDKFGIRMEITGDIMLDTSMLFSKLTESKTFPHLPDENFILMTLHRAENTDDPVVLKEIVEAVNLLSEKYTVVLPLHPRTKIKIRETGLDLGCHVISPVGYMEMTYLIKNSDLVITDSGGLQKEAYFFEKYCITLRNETEWTELVDNGYNYLVYSDFGTELINKVEELYGKTIENSIPLYGTGDAAGKIIGVLKEEFGR